jgi:hypothetical protein
MKLNAVRHRVLSGSILFVATVLMLTVLSEPTAEARPQAAAVAIPLAEALIKAAPSISSFFKKLFPDTSKAKPDQKKQEADISKAQNDGKTQLQGSVVREKILATVLRASSGAATRVASMSQMISNHTVTTEGEKVELRKMWSVVANDLKNIAKSAPNLSVFQAGSVQKLRLQAVVEDSGSMPEEVLKEIEGKDAPSCAALQGSLKDLGTALQDLNDAGAEELNVIADSLAALTLPEGDQTPEKGKKKADDLNKEIGFQDLQAIPIS